MIRIIWSELFLGDNVSLFFFVTRSFCSNEFKAQFVFERTYLFDVTQEKLLGTTKTLNANDSD